MFGDTLICVSRRSPLSGCAPVTTSLPSTLVPTTPDKTTGTPTALPPTSPSASCSPSRLPLSKTSLITIFIIGKKIFFHHDTDQTMPFELKSHNPNWRWVDFEGDSYVIDNVLFDPNGPKPQILRIATPKDPLENLIQIDLSYLGLDGPCFYIPAKYNEVISHPDLYWNFDGRSKFIVQIYSPTFTN